MNPQLLERAFRRCIARHAMTVAAAKKLQAKRHLQNLGISQRGVAPLLGIRFEHLNLVLNGHRDSRRLLQAIADLTPSEISNFKSPIPR